MTKKKAVDLTGEELISRAELAQLKQREEWLSALEAAGVDNWDGFDEANSIQAEWDREAAIEENCE